MRIKAKKPLCINLSTQKSRLHLSVVMTATIPTKLIYVSRQLSNRGSTDKFKLWGKNKGQYLSCSAAKLIMMSGK